MVKIIDIGGTEHEINCIACAIQSEEVTLPVERIAVTKYFVAEQDFEYPIEGFVIIASKRHVKSILEFTDEEQLEFTQLLIECRKAMKEKLGIEEVTIVQEETSSSSHFHVWLFPWLPWMSEYKRKVNNVMPIMDIAKQNSTEIELRKVKDAAKLLKEYFRISSQTGLFSKKDLYKNFQELASKNVEGVDYTITREDRGSDFAVIGIHGGEIESGTAEIVSAITKENLSLYIFSGTKKEQHITSTRFDEKECIDLVSKSQKIISVHGKKGKDEYVMLGGLDEKLISKLSTSLSLSGFKTIEPTNDVAGMQKNNICNMGISGSGLQLELSKGLRDSLVKDPKKMEKFAKIIRDLTS